MAKGKLRHIAISVPDKERAAKFYEETFGFERVSQSRVATRLSDGVMNITLLQFETEEDAGDERGKDFVGYHFGIWVDDIETMKQVIESMAASITRGQPATPRPVPVQVPRPRRHVRHLDPRLGRRQALTRHRQAPKYFGSGRVRSTQRKHEEHEGKKNYIRNQNSPVMEQ